MILLGLLALPFVVGACAYLLTKTTITLKEYALMTVLSALVGFGGYQIAKYGAMQDVEHWNGHITNKRHDSRSCCHCSDVCDSHDEDGNCTSSHEECSHFRDYYWLLDEVYFDGGLRYNIEHKEFTLASVINALEGNLVNAIPEETVSETWTGLTGDATLAWEPAGDWMYDAHLDKLNLYVKYGRGMKGGHFNAGLTIQSNVTQQQRIDPVEPEFIHSVEAGFKSRWLENRVVLNFALFRYWYKDLQVFDFTNEVGELPIQQLLNSDASVLGAELELQARPLPGLLIQFGGGWLDSEFLDFKVDKATQVPRGQGETVEFDYSGHPLISAPEWNFSSIVEYQIPLGRWGSIVPQYTVSFRSKVYLDPQMLDPISQEAHWQHTARLAYRTPDGRFELAGWVDNFTDERYKIDAFDLSLGESAILEVWNDPRTFGFTLSAYF